MLEMVPFIFLSMQLMKISTQDITFDMLREIGLLSLKKNHSRKEANIIQIEGLGGRLFALTTFFLMMIGTDTAVS